MAVTRLKRKGRKNKNVAKNRVDAMKRLNTVPPMKNIDIEAIKEEFAKSGKKAAPKVETVEEKTPKTEVVAPKEEKKAIAPKAKKEKAEAAGEEKKAAPKKKTVPKAKKKEAPKEEK